MKIAFVGKGGSGKTTLSSIFARYIASLNQDILVIDADINQHMAEALGMASGEAENMPPMGIESLKIKEYLSGENILIKRPQDMIKTTPPGKGSNLMTIKERNPVFDYFSQEVNGIQLMSVGAFTEQDLGVRCYHSKTGSVELILNHLIDREGEYVVVDMTAGADSFASGLFTRFDVTFLVVEPTLKSVSVYKQYKEYAQEYNLSIKVIGNKVHDDEDRDFLMAHVGDDLVSVFCQSRFVKSMEKGVFPRIEELEDKNVNALQKVKSCVDAQRKDWKRFQELGELFHIKNAKSWGNDASGIDLTKQIDPSFDLAEAIKNM